MPTRSTTLLVFLLLPSSYAFSFAKRYYQQTIMSDAAIEQFYTDIFADLSVDREEAAELHDFLVQMNPPPDKLTKLRASAFKVGCKFLSEDSKDTNVSLLRTINFVVHAIETNCMVPKEGLEGSDYDEDALTEFYKGIYDGLAVDSEENQELYDYFRDTNPPSPASLVSTRALAFKVGCDFLSDDTETNIKLLRCINVVIHALEMCCYQPKQYELKVDDSVDPSSLSLSEAVQQLWNLDVNRLTPNDDYDINVQGGKKPFWKDDAARDPLFASVDRSVWKRGTYAAFLALLDNYERETGRAETVTNSERAEVKTFLNAIMQTAPMQFCHQYCRAKNPSEVPADRAGFMKLLQTIWFDLYRREGVLDSSGFEHVFIGEVKNGDVSGFHNWIQFYLEEKKGDLDYRGYIKPRGSGQARQDDSDFLLTLQFSWKGIEKFVGTCFIGVSPEFEMALYTMCFLVGEQDNNVELDTGTDIFELVIKCYKMARGKIGTTFPEVAGHYEE